MGFHHGLSGLNAAARNLDVLGHNIANSNTVGFKRSRAEFNEMVAASMGTCGCNQAGTGVTVADIAQQFSQGVIVPTSNGLDMAINGNGFFVVNTPTGQAFTRSGNFQLNRVGELVTPNGDTVMGYPVDAETGRPTSNTLQKLVFPTGAPIPAKQTTKVTAIINLDARAQPYTGTMPNPGTDPKGMGTSIQVFDSLGVARNVHMYFKKVPNTNDNTWEVFSDLKASQTPSVAAANQTLTDAQAAYDAAKLAITGAGGVVDDAAGTITNAGTATPTQQQAFKNAFASLTAARKGLADSQAAEGKRITTLTFNTDGTIKSPAAAVNYTVEAPVTPGTPGLSPGVSMTGASAPITVNLDFSGMTQFGTSFAVSKLSQDGYTAGELTRVSVTDTGVMEATYSNGITRAEGQVALARFVNMQGLQPAGNNNWLATHAAGEMTLGSAKSGSFGAIQGSALEESNVDLTAELVGMMSAQRHYQANAQQIKTQDQVFSTLVNLR